jgi:hypothetical protein
MRIRIRISVKVISWIRICIKVIRWIQIRINLQMRSQMVQFFLNNLKYRIQTNFRCTTFQFVTAPPFHIDADPDPAFQFDADANPDPASQNDADPYGSGSATITLQNEGLAVKT